MRCTLAATAGDCSASAPCSLGRGDCITQQITSCIKSSSLEVADHQLEVEVLDHLEEDVADHLVQ